MSRFLQATPATITVTVALGGTNTDPSPDTATVTVTRDDGTILVAAAAATNTGTGTFSYTLTPTQTALLDKLTATWTVTLAGQAATFTTRHEIVGGFLFSLADLKSVNLGGAKTIGSTFTVDQMTSMRDTVEETIEQAVGRAFVPRYKRVTVRANRRLWSSINVRTFDVRAVRWITVDNVAVTAPELATLTYSDLGYVYGLRTRSSRYGGNIVAGIEYGTDEAPLRVKAAALLLARTWIVKGPVDDRVTTMSSPDTGITAALAVPGRGGSIVGIPEVDAVINEYRVPLAV